jgi:gas vesicle protein
MQNMNGQRQDEQSKASTFLIGLAVGAAVGAAVGLMLAPKTGTEIHRQVFEQADKLRKQAATAYGTASNVVGDVLSRGREAMDVGREAYQQARPNGNGSVRDMSGV